MLGLRLQQSRARIRQSFDSADVAMVHRGRVPGPLEPLRQLVGDHDAAVPAAGAADADRQVRLAFLLVSRQQQIEEPVELVEELPVPGCSST